MTATLSESERGILKSLAHAALPPGRVLPGARDSTLDRVEALLASAPGAVATGFRGLLWSLELRTAATSGTRFSGLPLGRQLRVMEQWERSEATRLALRGLLSPLKLAYFDEPSIYDQLGCRFSVESVRDEAPRWRQQVTPAGTLANGELLECDVVVVGTGAGGAPVAKELAARGHAVILVEEGELHTRSAFNGRAREMMGKLYRRGGFTVSFGNTAIPIPIGKAVGGTTLINSGTCFRIPEQTLAGWREKQGLREFTPEMLAPYYESVEAELGVAPSTRAAIGKPGELIARGCDALGYSHHPLARNAPGCDGQGLCCFGCPTDAKRSTNITYVPAALDRGAQLITGLKIERVLLEGERAVGVEGTASGPNGPLRVAVRSRAVVLSCGSLQTPVLLLENGLANASDQVGRNLSIHPASSAMGFFDEDVNSWNTVPQGYAIDHFAHEGILFEGGSVPLDLTAVALTGFGPAYVAQMERFNQTLNFGFMVKDESRGRVKVGRGGEASITYWLGDKDLAKLQRAMGILARVYLAAGAREVVPALAGFHRLKTLEDVERMEQARISARQMDLTAYHPLGTARMGLDPMTSVVDTTHETHDVHNLFICDGSAVPGSLGVNPQMTIMAMALRAAGFIDRRLRRSAAAS